MEYNKRRMLFVSNEENCILKTHKTIRGNNCKDSRADALKDITKYCNEKDSLWNKNFISQESVILQFINLHNYVEINLYYEF